MSIYGRSTCALIASALVLTSWCTVWGDDAPATAPAADAPTTQPSEAEAVPPVPPPPPTPNETGDDATGDDAHPDNKPRLQASELPDVSEAELQRLKAKARAEARARAERNRAEMAEAERILNAAEQEAKTENSDTPSPGLPPHRRERLPRGPDGKVIPLPEQPGEAGTGQAPRPTTEPDVNQPATPVSESEMSEAPKGPDGLPDLKKVEPKWYKLPPEDRPYFLSLNKTPVSKALDDIAEQTGLSWMGLNQIQLVDAGTLAKQLTFESSHIMSYDEMLTTFNLLMVDFDYWILERDDYLEIRKMTEWYRRIQVDRMFRSVDAYKQADLPDWELASVVYTPKEKSAASLAQTCVDQVPLNGARASVLPESGGVQLTGFVYFLNRQLAILDKMDVAVEDPREEVEYKLENIAPSEAAKMLEALLPKTGAVTATPTPQPTPRPGRGQQPQPTPNIGASAVDEMEIIEEPRRNLLIIRATPSKHEKVKLYLEKYIDIPITSGRAEMIKIEQADPTRLAEMIRPLLNKQEIYQPPTPNVPPNKPQPPAPPPQIRTIQSTAIITPVPHLKSLLVKAEPDEMKQIREYIDILDRGEFDENHVYKRLKYIDAAGLATMLQAAIGGGSSSPRRTHRGGADPSIGTEFRVVPAQHDPKALLMIGDKTQLEKAEELIAELDVDTGEEGVEHLVKLKSASPSTVQTILSSRFGGGSYSPYSRRGYSMGGGGSDLPKFIANDMSRLLIVVCEEEMWPDIEHLVNELDAGADVESRTKAYRLKHVSASSVVSILTKALLGNSVRYYTDPGAPQFGYDYQTNIVTVTAEDEMIKRAEALINELDQPTNERQTFSILLNNADAEDMASSLREIFTTARGRVSMRGDVPPAFTPTPGGKKLLVTCTSEELDDIKDFVSELDGEDAAANKKVTETIQLKNVSADDMENILESVYRTPRSRRSYGYSAGSSDEPTFEAISGSGMLVVSAPQREMEEIRTLIEQLDVEDEGGARTEVYTVENADPWSVASAISSAYRSSGRYGSRDSVSASADYNTGAIIVTANDEKQTEVADLIKRLDVGTLGDRVTLEPIQLNNADPEYVAGKLEEMFGETSLGGSRRYNSRAQDAAMRIIPEPVSNRLLITGSKKDFEQAKQFAQELDAQYAEQEYQREIFRIENAETYEVARVLQTMFGDSSGSSGYSSSRYRWSRSHYSSDQPGSVKIVEAGEMIIVHAPKDKMEEISETIDQLDASTMENNEIRTYKVEGTGYYGSSEIARNLDRLYSGQDYRSRSSAGVQFIGSYSSNLLFVSAPKDEFPKIDKLVQQVLDTQDQTNLTNIIRHFDVKGDPNSLIALIQPIVESRYEELQDNSGSRYRRMYGSSGGPQLIPHPSGNRIMVSAPEVMMELIEQLIADFDGEQSESTRSIVKLDVAKAAEVAPMIEQMIAEAESSGGSSGYGYRSSRYGRYGFGYGGYGSRSSGSSDANKLVVIPMESSNSIMLKGPVAKVHEAEQLIKEIDAKAEPEGNVLQVKKIEHADLFDVMSMIDDMVGGTSSGMFGMSGSGGGEGSVIVRPDYMSNQLIISAPREKLPMIEQVIELQEAIAIGQEERASVPGSEGSNVVDTDVQYGTITKAYDIPKDAAVDEIARALDQILVDLMGYSKAPYVKSFPFANQILVEGKPEQFETVEKYFNQIMENPPKPRIGLVVKRVKKTGDVPVARIVDALQRWAPSDTKLNIREVPRFSDKPDPMSLIDEVGLQPSSSTRPVGENESAPFVPSGSVRLMQEAVAKLSWLQSAEVAADADAPTTQPAEEAPAPALTVTEEAPADTPAATPVSTPEPKAATKDHQLRGEVMEAAVEAQSSNEIQIRYDEEEGIIMVVGAVHKLEELEELLDEIISQYEDLVEEQSADQIRVFRVHHVDVTVAAKILEQMFGTAQAKKAPQGKKPQARQQQQQQPKQASEAEGEDGESIREKREAEEEETQETDQQQMAGGGIRVVPDPRTRTLIIRAASQDFPRIAELLVKIDQPHDKPARDIQIFQLETLNAYDVEQAIKSILGIDQAAVRRRTPRRTPGGSNEAQMIEQLQQEMLELQRTAAEAAAEGGEEGEGTMTLNPSKDITLASFAMTNSIIVSAPEEGLQLVRTLIDKLEKLDIPMMIKSFKLENAEAEKVSAELQKLFVSRGGSSRRGPGGEESITPSRVGEMSIASDTRTNTIVVKALEPDMEKIVPIIEGFDIPADQGLVQVYRVEHGDAETRATTLRAAFAGMGDAAGPRAISITADPEANVIVAKAPDNVQTMIEAKNMALDDRIGGTTAPRQIELQFALPSAVAQQLQQIYASEIRHRGNRQVTIVPDDSSGVILVRAPESMFQDIQKLARQMDNQTPQKTERLVLEHATARDVVSTFQSALRQSVASLGSAGAFDVTADELGNALILTGGDQVHAKATEILTKIDVKGDASTSVMTTYVSLGKADAETVARSAEQLYRGVKFPTGISAPNIVPVKTSNMVYIHGTEEQINTIRTQVIEPMETSIEARDVLVKDFVIPLEYAKADDVADALSKWWSNRMKNMTDAGFSLLPAEKAVIIQADPVGKRLLVNSTEENFKRIEEQAKTFDLKDAGEGQLVRKAFVVRYANPTYTQRAIDQMFPAPRNAPEVDKVYTAVEYDTSTVVVRASKENMAEIEDLIEEIDVDQGMNQLTETIKVENVSASEVARQLTSIMSSRRRTRQGQYPATFSAIDETNTLLVKATAKEIEDVKKLIEMVDVAPDPATERKMKLYSPKYVSASSVISVVQQSFRNTRRMSERDQVTAIPEYSSGAVVVYASDENHEKIASIIEDMDKAGIEEMTAPVRIPVKNVLASQLEKKLTEMIRTSMPRDIRTRQYPVTVTADDLSNSLLVKATSEKYLDDIKQLISQMDVVPESGDDREVTPYPIQFADMSVVAGIINTRFAGNNATRAINDQVDIQPDYATGTLVVTASSENQKKIEALLATLDKADVGTQPKLETIDIHNVRATTLSRTLTDLIRQRWKPDRRTRLYPVSVTPDDATNTLLVTAAPRYLEETKALIEQLDKPRDEGDERKIEAYQIKYADVSSLYTMLNSHFADNVQMGPSDQVNVAVEWASGTLVVTASEENQAKVRELIDTLDTPDRGAVPELETVQLKHAKPSQIYQTLVTIIRQTTKPNRYTGIYPVSVMPNDASNSIVISATPEHMAKMKKTIAQLDVAGELDNRVTKPYVIEHADLASVYNTINSRYAASRYLGTNEQVVAAIDYSLNAVNVTASPENQEAIAQMIESLDQDLQDEQKTYTFDVKNVDAEDLARALTTIYQTRDRTNRSRRSTALFTVPRGGTTMMVTTTEDELPEIERLIKELDVEDPTEQRDVRVVSVMNMTATELGRVLTEYMRRPGKYGARDPRLLGDVKILPSDTTSTVSLTGPAEMLDELEALARKIDDSAVVDADQQRKIRVFTLQQADAYAVSSVINSTFRPTGRVPEAEQVYASAERTTGSLIVLASEKNMQRVEELVTDLDSEGANKLVERIVKLEVARAEDLADVLTATYRSSGRSRSRPPISIQPDPNTNALVISAGKADFEGVMQMIEQLDVSATDKGEQLRVIPLQFIDATEMLDIMTEHLRKPGTRSRRGSTELIGDLRLQASAGMNALIVSGKASEIDNVEQVIKGMDKEMPGVGTAPRICKLEHAQAGQLVQTLTEMFTEPAQRDRSRRGNPDAIPLVFADDTTNSLIVRARAVDYNLIEDMIEKLDVAPDDELSGMRVIQVSRGMDVRSLASQIERTVNLGERAKASQRQGYRAGQVTIGVDERVPALFVAGTPQLFDTVEKLVNDLQELKPQGGTAKPMIIRVQNRNADDVKRVLEQFINQQQGGSSSNRRRR